MRIVTLQHEEFEDQAYLMMWAEKRGHAVNGIKVRNAHQNGTFPDIQDFDFLWIMGGSMSVHDTEKFPWLVPEKRFILEAIEARKHILGICLGAQLLADTLGAPVRKSGKKEIGWFPVKLNEECRRFNLFRNFPETFTPFHWHGEMFDIPSGAVRIGESEACPSQGFIQDRILALQFHLESTDESVRSLLASCGSELAGGPFVQNETKILDGTREHLQDNQRLLENLLDGWLDETK